MEEKDMPWDGGGDVSEWKTRVVLPNSWPKWKPAFPLSAELDQPDQWSSWSFKVLTGTDSSLGGRPPGAKMVQAFQGGPGSYF